jgi:hypothetical protein
MPEVVYKERDPRARYWPGGTGGWELREVVGEVEDNKQALGARD